MEYVVTTNYDELIETAAKDIGEGDPEPSLSAESIAQYRLHKPLLKIHGTVTDKDHTLWCKTQLRNPRVLDAADSILRARVFSCLGWLRAHLLEKDLDFVDFWTDWKYFNELFGNYLKSVHGQSISLGGDGVLRDAFSWAGFKDIEEQRAPAPLKMKSAAECLRFEKESFGALHTMLAGLDEGGKAGAWREIETELQKFESGSSFEGSCELIVIAGSA